MLDWTFLALPVVIGLFGIWSTREDGELVGGGNGALRRTRSERDGDHTSPNLKSAIRYPNPCETVDLLRGSGRRAAIRSARRSRLSRTRAQNMTSARWALRVQFAVGAFAVIPRIDVFGSWPGWEQCVRDMQAAISDGPHVPLIKLNQRLSSIGKTARLIAYAESTRSITRQKYPSPALLYSPRFPRFEQLVHDIVVQIR